MRGELPMRIYRTYKWAIVNDGRLGGTPRYGITHEDQLQYFDADHQAWMPVDIIEAEKPKNPDEIEREEAAARLAKAIEARKNAPPVDRTAQQLVSGNPVTPDHKDILPGKQGMQRDYVVLSPEERAKGFVRPVRRSYEHIGVVGPKYPLRDLTPEERDRYLPQNYVKYEEYPQGMGNCGMFWTQERLDKVGKGCGVVTTMAESIAETYARDPSFYGGTYCAGCHTHLPVGEHGEFIWDDGSNERVGT